MNDIPQMELKNALNECRNAARQGYVVAKANLVDMQADIRRISHRLSSDLRALDSSKIRTKEVDAVVTRF